MKLLEFDLGGRPATNDDLLTLQTEAAVSAFAPFADLGPFIVSGIRVSGTVNGAYSVSAGIVALDGQFLRFYGASNVTLPAQLQRGGFDFIDMRPYQTGGTKACIRERAAVLVTPDSSYTSGEFLPFDVWGGKRLQDIQRATVRSMGEVQPVANVRLSDYDEQGAGKPGTEAWGWALCDGQDGRADLRGTFIAGLDPNRTDYDTVGKTGGRETVQLTSDQNGPHSHTAPSYSEDEAV